MQWDAGRWYKDVPESVSGIKRVLLVRRKRKSNLTLHYFIVAKNAERYAKIQINIFTLSILTKTNIYCKIQLIKKLFVER